MKHWAVVILAALTISGCGDRSLNPFSWFGGQEEQVDTVSDFEIVTIEDPRPLIPQVTSLRIDRTPGGAIIRATGLPTRQGWHSAALVARDEGRPTNGVITYDFRAAPPTSETLISTVQSREIVVARTLSNTALQNVRTIRVVGANNVMSVRR